MARGRFTSPFRRMSLNSVDMNELQVVAKAITDANLKRYEDFVQLENSKVDASKWKLVKTKDDMRVFRERQQRPHFSPPRSNLAGNPSPELQSLMCVGTTSGTLDDVMLGVVSPTLESIRTKTSYVKDVSGAAVLSTIQEPTDDEPFRSIVVKWMELDIRMKSMGLVKNRDYVYVESTGVRFLPNGEEIGYHVMHSVDFPQAHELSERVRSKLSVCSFFRQASDNTVSVYIMGMMDHMSDRVRRLVVPSFIKTMMSTLKYAHCGEMKRLGQALTERFAEIKNCGPMNPDHNCISCTKSLRVWRFGKVTSRRSTCKLCFGYVCSTCKIDKKLSFLTPDLKMTQRKVTFCPCCFSNAISADMTDFSKTGDWRRAPGSTRTRKRSAWSTDWGTVLDIEESSSTYDFASTR